MPKSITPRPATNIYTSEDGNWLVVAESLDDANALVSATHGWDLDELADEGAEVTTPWPENRPITIATPEGRLTLTPAQWCAREGRGILLPREHDCCPEPLPAWAQPREEPEPPARLFFVSFVLALRSQLSAALSEAAIAATHTLLNPAASPSLDRQRAYRCADWAVRHLAADALETARHVVLASSLRSLPPIDDRNSAHLAAKCARAAHQEALESYHRDPERAPAALYAATCVDAARSAARAAATVQDLTVVATHVAHAVSSASYAATETAREHVLRTALSFVYELCVDRYDSLSDVRVGCAAEFADAPPHARRPPVKFCNPRSGCLGWFIWFLSLLLGRTRPRRGTRRR